jgi:hypothetical protein
MWSHCVRRASRRSIPSTLKPREAGVGGLSQEESNRRAIAAITDAWLGQSSITRAVWSETAKSGSARGYGGRSRGNALPRAQGSRGQSR